MTREIEIQKYEIDKKFELQQQKLESANMIKVGNETLASISLMADKFARAGDLIPKEFQANPEKCFVAIYKGASLGLDAFTSLQRIAVINGRATIWGDTALALVRKSGLMVKFEETIIETEKDNMIARCIVQRKGEAEHVSEYSQKEAVTAGLWGNNVWKKYPKRMLKYRARAFALRDIFADVLDGLYLKEEIEGGEDFKDITPKEEPKNDYQKIGHLAWGKDDIKNDFGDVAPREKPQKIIEPTKTYDQIVDAMALCESGEDFAKFEHEFSRDIKALNKEDFTKLSAMIEAAKADINQNQ